MWFAEGFWREVNLFLMSPHEPFLSCWVIWPQMGEIWALVCRLLTSCKALRCGFVSQESTQLLCPWASFLPGLCPPSWVLGRWAWQSCSALLAPCLCHSSVGGQGLGAPGEMFGQSIKSEYSDFIRKQIRLLTCLEQNLVWVKPSLQLSHFVLHKASPSSGEVLSSSWTKVQDCTTFEPNSGFDPHFKSGFLGWEGLLQAEPRVWTQASALPCLGSRGQHNHLGCCRDSVCSCPAAQEWAQGRENTPSSEIRGVYLACQQTCHWVCMGKADYPNCSSVLCAAVLALCFAPLHLTIFQHKMGTLTCPCPHRDLGHAAGVSCGR